MMTKTELILYGYTPPKLPPITAQQQEAYRTLQDGVKPNKTVEWEFEKCLTHTPYGRAVLDSMAEGSSADDGVFYRRMNVTRTLQDALKGNPTHSPEDNNLAQVVRYLREHR
jgi:hypothetical protein